jgi:hypothetical protein
MFRLRVVLGLVARWRLLVLPGLLVWLVLLRWVGLGLTMMLVMLPVILLRPVLVLLRAQPVMWLARCRMSLVLRLVRLPRWLRVLRPRLLTWPRVLRLRLPRWLRVLRPRLLTWPEMFRLRVVLGLVARWRLLEPLGLLVWLELPHWAVPVPARSVERPLMLLLPPPRVGGTRRVPLRMRRKARSAEPATRPRPLLVPPPAWPGEAVVAATATATTTVAADGSEVAGCGTAWLRCSACCCWPGCSASAAVMRTT